MKIAILIFSLILVFVSCVSVPPVSSGREHFVGFQTIESVQPTWQPLSAGVDYFHGKVTSPRFEFHAVRIDLHSSQIQIIAMDGFQSGNAQSGSVENSGSVSLSAKVSSFVRDNNLIVGINAVPFDVSTSREGQPIRNFGIVISEGELLSLPVQNYDAIVFYRNEEGRQNTRAAIVSQSSITSIENIQTAVGGFHKILAGGEPTQRTREGSPTSVAMTRHPRSAAGLSQDGRFLYLVVIDGRRPGSAGATEEETAFLLRTLGCFEALNLDGGGSTTLAMRHDDGSVKVVNTPVHGYLPGRERAVAGCLGVKNF